MKKLLIFTSILLLTGIVYSKDVIHYRFKPKLELSVNFGLGFLISGTQKELGDETLLPKPDSYLPYSFGADLSFFLLDFIGINGGYNFNLVEANSKNVGQSITDTSK